MPKLITKDNHIRKKYELSATKDTVISLNNPQDVVINGSQAQAIGVIKHRYYNYFVLFAQRYASIKVNGENVASHIRLLHDGDEVSFNGKVFLFAR